MALVSFYIKLIRLDQKRVGLASLSGEIRISKGMARLAEPVRLFLVAPDNQKTLTWLSVYHALLADLMMKISEINEKQTQFCPKLLTSRMRYHVNG